MKSSYRTCVIVNPNSSNGATARHWPGLERKLSSVLDDFKVAQTARQGHATSLARQALSEGYEMIVAVGGDGTVHEVVNGFFNGDKPADPAPILGLMPSGTGGDYRKTWGMEAGPEAAINRLGGLDVQTVDAGKITWSGDKGPETRYFANIASIGLGGAVSKQANEQSKVLGGKASFFVASARALLRYHNKDVVLTTDGGEPRHARVTVAAFCVGRFFGGGMMIGPNADPSDGKFDVVTIENATRLEMVRMTSIYKGQHLDHPKVSSWQGASVAVDGSGSGAEQVLIEADGEVFGRLPALFEVMPSAFKIKV